MSADPLAGMAALVGMQIPGGCEDCDAYQTVDCLAPGIWRVLVHHADGCRTYARIEASR